MSNAADKTDVLWFLPTHGEGRYLGTETGARHVTLGYLSQVARAADELGYYGVLLPTGKSCEDSWLVASAMVPLTQRLRFLVAVSPGLSQPDMSARMAATLDREYMALGIDRFILSGDPHLEECHRFAELVFPLLPLKSTTGNDLGPARNAGPFGEVIANFVAPPARAAE